MKKYLVILALMVGASISGATDNMPKAGHFVWNELATTDVKAAKDFYGNVFGWEFTDEKVGDMTYTLVKKGDRDFAGIWAIPTAQQSQIPSHWIAYISVDNIDQTLEKARQSGAKVLKPVQKIGDKGSFAILQDPSGAHFALWQKAKD